MPDLINSLKELIESEDFRNRHKSGPNDFTRKRALSFERLIYFFINLPAAAYEAELNKFNKELNGLEIAEHLATKGALSSARKKLKAEAFVELNDHLIWQYEMHFNPILWHGFRLLAIDGTLATIPTAEVVAKHFGQWNGRQGNPCPKARVSQLYDVLNHFTVDAIICPKSTGERDLAATHCLKMLKNDLLLLDRGYEGFCLLRLIVEQGGHFCARVSCNKMKIVRAFVKSGLPEQIVKFKCSYSAARKCKELGVDKHPIKLRLIRVELASGEIEVLMTSLRDKTQYPIDVFADLYHQRWPIEEDYKLMKSRIRIENFSGKTVHSVYQDFHSKMFSKNLTAIFIQSVKSTVQLINSQRKQVYKTNFTHALATVKQHLVVLFHRVEGLLDDAILKIQALIERSLNEVRKGRSLPRDFKKSSRKKYHTAYKPIS